MRAARIAIAIALGLIVSWFIFDALSQAIALPLELEARGMADRTPYLVLWASVILPAVIYGVALIVGWRQSLSRYTLVAIVGLCVIATARLSLYSLVGFLIR